MARPRPSIDSAATDLLVFLKASPRPEGFCTHEGHSREIVVPLMDGDMVLGEIDIDSDRPSNFGPQDRKMLEAVADVVVERLKEIY